MELRRRFIFRGNAAAIGGRIVRPTDLILDSIAASSLTVAGGRSRQRAGVARFGEFISFAGATTNAEGLFDDVQQQIEFTYGKVPEDALTTSTRVGADVTGLSVGDRPNLTIKRLHATLTSKSPAASGQPAIALGADTAIEGVAIDGHPIAVEMAVPVFQQYDTHSKLLAAADDPQFVRESGDLLYLTSPAAGVAAPPTGRLQYGCGTIYATIVKAIKWAGEPVAGVAIEQNALVVPEFGKIFFGELLITDMSRRLTMLRLELGSPVGGAVACAEVETNGIWST
jgi:hypothetical protein